MARVGAAVSEEKTFVIAYLNRFIRNNTFTKKSPTASDLGRSNQSL